MLEDKEWNHGDKKGLRRTRVREIRKGENKKWIIKNKKTMTKDETERREGRELV